MLIILCIYEMICVVFRLFWNFKQAVSERKDKIKIMWIADNWKDYEVIDCSMGEKLERWGDYFLIRPDPQVIWDTPKTQKGWKKPNGHYHRSKKGGGEWEFFDLPHQWQIGRAHV